MPSLRLPKLPRRNPDRPTLKQRAAALKALVARRGDDPDRDRRFVMAGSLAAALPLPALAASRDLAAHPDAELLALGQKLNETVRAYLAIQPAHRDAERRYGEAFGAAFHGVPSLSDEEFIPRMREVRAPFAAELDPGDSLVREWDRLSDEIVRNHRPVSLAGVAVVASVVAAWHHGEWSKPADDRDWPEQIATHLASAVLALAGRENVPASFHPPLQEAVSRG